jgi:hypothetical protein
VTLGFSVDELLPRARGGGPLKIGLAVLGEDDWLQPRPDLAARHAAFDAYPESTQVLPDAVSAGDELAAMMGVAGGLEGAARSAWEDMCLLTRVPGEAAYRLTGAAVAFPTDWRIADKLGHPMITMHTPIHGYAEQLGSPVDQFMAKLKPGRIYGRCNWFVSPTPALRWLAEDSPLVQFAHVTPENAGETLFVRSERQTLRKLPESGAIVFTIGIYLAPLGSLSPENMARMAESLATIPEPEAKRRGAAYFAPQLQAYAERHGAAIGQAA